MTTDSLPKLRVAAPVAGVLAAALALRVALAAATPAWRAADEYPYYWVAAMVAETGQLPRGWHGFPAYESFQPPLYYLLQAPLLALPPGGMLEFTEERIPPPADLFRGRLLSAVLGTLIVGLAYGAAVRAGWGRPTGLRSAGFAAFLPTLAVVSSSFSVDVLVTFLSSAALAVILAPRELWSSRTALWGGILAGAALLVKLNALLILPVLLLRIAQVAEGDRRSFRRFALASAWGILAALILLAARNMLQYQELLAIMPGRERDFSFSLSHLVWALRNLGWSFWLAFGRTYDVVPASAVYLLAVVPMVVAAALGWKKEWNVPQSRPVAWLALTGLAGGILLSLALTMSYPEGTQTSWGKNLYPAVVLIAMVFVRGWERAAARWPRALPAVFLATMLAGCLWGLAVI